MIGISKTGEEKNMTDELYNQLLDTVEWSTLEGMPMSTVPSLIQFRSLFIKPFIMTTEDFANATGLIQSFTQEIASESKTISLNVENAIEYDLLYWIEFWQNQFLQHIAYLDLLIAKLPDVAFTPQSPLKSTLDVNQPEIGPGIEKSLHLGSGVVKQLQGLALPIVNGWKTFQDFLAQQEQSTLIEIPISLLYSLCRWTMMFKFQLWAAEKQGIWMGSAWLGLVEHMMEELVAFIMRLSGMLNDNQEIVYLTNMIADHISLVGHAVTPGGEKEIRNFVFHQLKLAEEGYTLIENEEAADHQELAEYIDETIQDFDKTMPLLLSQRIPTINIPVDVYHMKREHDFALNRLSLKGYAD